MNNVHRFWVIGLSLLMGCGPTSETKKEPDGAELVATHCSGCHLPVKPEQLDKETWLKHVLPAMAPKLGIPTTANGEYYQVANNQQKSALSFAEWTQLVAYFEKNAPDSLKAAPREALKQDWSIFALEKPSESPESALTTMVQFHEGKIYSGQNGQPTLYAWDKTLRRSEAATLNSPVVNAAFVSPTEAVVTTIGTLLAVDQPVGEVVNVDLRTKKTKVIANALIRPIQSVPGDFNKDGRTDWIICGFGHNQGGLYLSVQQADGSYQTQPIRAEAGATQVVVDDFNKDGWPDCMALFAHGDEGLWLFTNDQKGGFEARNVQRFLPLAGSTSFQLIDLNKDGQLDLVYTSGDNSDYSKILKPYHGVYTFINQGDFKFKQQWFYPVNGSTKVIAADFDQDGDMDLATIAFFADFKRTPEESFIYFEQEANGHFVPHAVPAHAYGRWICMDAQDWDGDGDLDIVLGNYSRGFNNQDDYKPNWNMQLPFIVLRNKTRK
ncbi:FG-GAP repeat domain-containing protein [Siphonobacter curvatus]|uniref:VCBS repeat-containing protein n=1 Tax=Siphonobacter curvatus TaxID=2094562 RepID=A0A2S7IQS3_9BACT|nr:VCBS repeat-containing protein [Siphonobacter curvatus]PQA60019.1 hypothetical protein C5O19_10480 [Siphonobacter curvatus]